jgi:hypothetical protein
MSISNVLPRDLAGLMLVSRSLHIDPSTWVVGPALGLVLTKEVILRVRSLRGDQIGFWHRSTRPLALSGVRVPAARLQLS